MKTKSLLAALSLLLVALTANAQGNFNPEEMFSRMANRLAKNMKLEDSAKDQFTALYIEYQTARMKAAGQDGQQGNQRVDLDNITDEEATALIEKTFKTQEAQLAVDREYYTKFIKVITPAQAAQVFVRRAGMSGQRMGGMRQRGEGFGGPGGGPGGF